MTGQDNRSALLEAFKGCLERASQGTLDNRSKYYQFENLNAPVVAWSLDTDWYVEGELYQAGNLYLQRKVMAEFKPGDFFIIPPQISSRLKVFARTDKLGSCHFSTLPTLLASIDSPELLQVIGHKLAHFLFVLTEFEKEMLKPSLNRPVTLQPDQEVKIPHGSMGLCGAHSFWMKRGGMTLQPKPRTTPEQLPEYWFIHSNAAFVNEREDIETVMPLSNAAFFAQADAQNYLLEQVSFQWKELIDRWSDHFQRLKQQEDEHSSRNDIYSQSIRGRLLNLLSGKKSYLPDTPNHTLRASFYLINKLGWLPSIPRETEFDNPIELMEKIAASSGLIMRESRLRGEWWKRDAGSFVVMDKEGMPLVLYYKRGSYRVWNPIDDKTVSLTPKVREKLSNIAVYYFKQLPAQPLTLFDLIFFEVQSVRSEIMMVLLLAIIMSGLVALLPVLSAYVVNVLLPSALTGLLAVVCGGLVVVGLFQTVFTWFDTMLMTRINYKLTLASNAALWHRVLHFPSKVLRQHASGDIAMRMTTCLGMQEFFRTIGQRLIVMIFQIATSLGVVMWVSFELGMGVLAFGLIALIAAFAFTYWQIRAFMAGEKSLGIVNSYILELYSGIHKIKAAGAESECIQQWAERYSRLRQKLLASQKVRILHGSFQTGWVTLTTALVYWMIVRLSGVDLEPAMFIAFLGAFAIFSGNLSALCTIIIQSGIQVPMFKFIKPLIENSPECKADLMTPDKVSGHLRVDRVSYHYPGQNTAAVQEVTFLVKQGSFVVVAGGSGSGKSTLGRLLSGLEKPHGGHVFLDDYELHTLDPKVLRGNIAVVPQEFRLINGTLHENIKGSSSATLDDIISAAKAACIWDEIDALPMKLHTLTGTQFGAFSGGQIQRIAIARALIRKPRILIMDEATSALDNKLQEQIISNVRSMNCTVIFIAHRLKVARDADQIFVLDSGQCVERGTHDELIGYGKFYAKMWQAMS